MTAYPAGSSKQFTVTEKCWLGRRTASTFVTMANELKWWRAKPPYLLGSSVNWFERAKAYPGRELHRSKLRGTVRVFRDGDAFEKEIGSLSIDVPRAWLDEVEPPR